MQSVNEQNTPNTRGFTIIELLIVIAIIIVLTSMMIPALGKAFAAAKSTEDKMRVKGVYSAMVLDATGNEGRFPQPSSLGEEYTTATHDTSDTTANLMSLMIARNYFKPDFLISPVETNPNIQDINADDLDYDYDSIDGEDIFWDVQFRGDVAGATATMPAHNSYAHQALCGQRIRLKWHSAATASDIILSNRGPESELDNSVFDFYSHTLKFHGDETTWTGNIVCGDGSTRLADNRIPEGIAYQPLNGMPLGPDNIFVADWNDVPMTTAPAGMPSGDNWMVICTEVISDNEITAVWD